MSDDESTYERTRMMNRYLYGTQMDPPDSGGGGEQVHIESSATITKTKKSPKGERKSSSSSTSSSSSSSAQSTGGHPTSEDMRYRSKSHESGAMTGGRVLRPGIMRVKNKEIERGVRIRNINSLVHSQQDRLVNEKKELNELNHRLDGLVESLKMKKAQNDELQDRLAKIRENILYGADDETKYKRALDHELENAKRELNNVSEMSTLSKIRASRSMYDLDKVREMYDDEVITLSLSLLI